ncbi:putative peptidoglycan lipid II flippase [Promicromonospora sp. AC04]|uniref:murein biosynthesis integral membrane protein MurJ n=1 Tax=Promicromonospora sp. AC04 TaxID=2135723 RepID=UPI000D3568C4|nr:murein biosynthesis integral membrane protein MurJ [Promicromonospora sp. AC04]PUB28784.1 putative peptidoglycan lipid II flippase [Promicromonospora sp. AC04]
MTAPTDPASDPSSAAASGPDAPVTPSSTSSLGRNSIVMAAGTAASRLGGLVRNLMLVAAIGSAGTVANAFDVANKLPGVLFAILAGGMLNAVLVPQIVKAFRAHNTQERIDKLLTISAVGILAVTAALTGAAAWVVMLYTDGWTAEQLALGTVFAYWCIPQLFFFGLYTLLGQVLNAREQFGPFMWAPVANNVVSILGFGIFLILFGSAPELGINDLSEWDTPRTLLLAGTATLGIVTQALVLLVPLLRSGFRWNFRLGFRGVGLRSAGSVALWTLAAVVLEQAGVLYLTRVTSGAAVSAEEIAGNASYTQALLIYLLPHSLVTVSIATALFTGISKAAQEGDTDRVRADLSLGLRTIGVFTVFATAALVVLAGPLTAFIVPTAREAGTALISPVLVALAFGLVPLGGQALMKWVFYAYEDGRSVFWITVPSTVALVAGLISAQIWLEPQYWVIAAGGAYALSNWITVLLRTGGLRKKLDGRLDGGRILLLHAKLILAAGVSGLAGWGVYQLVGGFDVLVFGRGWALTMLSGLWVTALCGLVMLAIYVLLLRLLRVQELNRLLGPVLARLKR